MSNLLKSKFLIGVMTVAIMFVGVVAVSATTASADCSITSTLRVGSKGTQVVCLQTFLDHAIVADGAFGPKTKAAVVAWQKTMDLVADGIFGPKSNKVWASNSSPLAGGFAPAGCTTASGYSPTLGLAGGACHAVASQGNNGCQSGWLYNPATGIACTGGVINQSGPLTASLSLDNPASGSIIAGQAIADLAHFAFSGTGTLNQVTLQRTGISANSDLSNVYLFDGVTRVSDAASVNTNGVISFNNLNLPISGTKIISVKADISLAAVGTVGVRMTSYSVTGGTATAVSISGNEMFAVSATLAGVVVGAVSPALATTVNAGTNSFVLWSAPVQVNTRAVNLKSVAFQIIGSAPADALQNVKLYSNGTQVGTASAVSGLGYITFDMSAAPVVLQTGSATLEVRGDIVKGSSRTISLALQNVSDLMVVDSQYNVNVAATGIPKAAGTVAINSGSVAVNLDPTFSATTITAGINNATIAKYNFKAYGEDVKISYIDVTPSVNIDNVAIYANGGQVSGNIQSYTGTKLHFTTGSSLIIPAGTTVSVEVRADTKAAGVNLVNATTVAVTLNGYANNAQGVTSSTLTTVPSSDQAGPTLTVGIAGLTLAKTSSFIATQDILANTDNQKVGSFTITAGSSEGVRITNFNADLTASTLPVTSMSGLYIKYGTTTSTPIPSPSATANNFPVDITLAASGNVVVDVYANVGSATTVTNTNTLAADGVGAQTLTRSCATTCTTVAGAGVKATRDITVTGTTGWDATSTATVTINGFASVYTSVAADESPTTVAAGIVAAININTNVNGIVLASNVAGVVTVSAKVAGTAGNAITLTTAKNIVGGGNGELSPLGASSMASGAATAAQVDNVTPAFVEIGDVFTLGYGSTSVQYIATANTVANVTSATAGLAKAWNDNATLAAIATATNGTTYLALTAVTPNVVYVYTATAANGSHSSTGLAIQVTLSMSATGIVSNSIVASNPTSIAGQVMTIADGSITIATAIAGTSPRTQFVAGGTSQPLVTYTFKSAVGSAVIDELKFNVTNPAAFESLTVNGKTQPASSLVDIDGLNISIPMSFQGTPVVVTASWNPVGIGQQTSGVVGSIDMTYMRYHVGNTPYTISTTTNDPSNNMFVVAAFPIVTSPQTSTTGLVGGDSPGTRTHLMDFTVAPSSASGNITLKSVSFTSSFAGGASLDATLPTINIGSTPISGASCTSAAPIVCTFPSAYQITASTILSLWGNIAGTLTAGVASVTTTLTSPATFIWTDTNGAASPDNMDSENTTYMVNFPTLPSSVKN